MPRANSGQVMPDYEWRPNLGARLSEPPLVSLQIKPLRVTDPRSVFKSGHYQPRQGMDKT